MPRTWQTSGVIYAQDDFPQCALYTAIGRDGDGGGGGGFRQGAKKRGADVSGAPLFPFAFSINGADVEDRDETPVGGGGGVNGEEETWPLFVATWRRDREQRPAETDTGPRRHVVRRPQRHLPQMSLIPMDYGIAVSDFV